VYYVYILSCADGSFYVGSTQNLGTRKKLTVMDEAPHTPSSTGRSVFSILRDFTPGRTRQRRNPSSNAGAMRKKQR
jgi:hypothetical protein